MRRLARGAVLAAATALAGCGVGAGPKPSGVTLTVQRDFGAHRMGTAGPAKIRGSDTVMRLLERSFAVKTRYGGRFVQSLGGVAGGRVAGRPVDWFYYVNGLEAPRGAADTGVRSGDHIIWDFHDWGATQDVPAIVGSFPEPFLSGSHGTRYPVRLECAAGAQAACDVASRRLTAAGVSAPRGTVGSGSETDSYRILVGTLARLAGDPAEQRLARGVGSSGVYAQPRRHGRALAVLDARGRVATTLGRDTGLIAALRPPGSQPVWLVTGTTPAGVKAAAAQLTRGALAGKFAAVVTNGRAAGLPEAPGVIAYRRRATPLHAARAAAGAAWCAGLAVIAIASDHPAMIGAAGVAALLAGALAGVGRGLLRTLLFSLPVALLAALINPFVAHEGLTVIARLGTVPVLGRLDLTLEATVYGLLTGLRLVVLILTGALYTLCVDPDEVLRLVRRVSFRSALTATLATRLVPVLARDARRVADAQRCRPGDPPSRVALLRAVAAGALDRAVDVAAALETRGYGAARRPPRSGGRPWSRHDIAFAAAGAGLVALALAGRLTGAAHFAAYPALHAAGGAPLAVLAAAVLLVALAPFADRRGIAR